MSMAVFLKKIRPVSHDAVVDVNVVDDDDDGDDDNVEYSFAMEYKGPPVGYAVPQVVPVNIDYIPTASVVYPASTSTLTKLSIPVIQPIEKRCRLKKFPEESDLGVKAVAISLCEVTDCEETVEEGHDQALSSELVESGTLDVFNVDDLLRESSVGIDLSGVLGLTSDEETKPDLSDGRGSSGSLGYFAGFHDSLDSSGRSNALRILEDHKEDEGIDIQDCINPTEDTCISADLTMASRSFSSHNSICTEHGKNETPLHVSTFPAVTVSDPEHDFVSEESDHEEVDIIQVRQRPVERKEKKSSCYRCGKGNRFTEKESCIVCGVNFCGDCVLRAMGSMPEGRKCITCIGQPINESKRSNLGKSSRMLKRLLTKTGAKQIMRLELLSKANQLQPELVYVNDKPLSEEEILMLQSCANPPKKLKPKHYWYDKVSGYWGKKGKKPCQIISTLNIGHPIMRNASNGNTNVLINNREITKVELMMLQFAGVECEGSPKFWMDADGSIKEEGMKNERGRIWDKTGIRLFCAVLSLPTPPEGVNTGEEEAVNIGLHHPDEKYPYKLLLVGSSESGTSTILKQAKLLYKVPFNGDERQNIKFTVQSNLYNYLSILLERRQCFEEEISMNLRERPAIDESNSSSNVDEKDKKTVYSLGPRLKDFSDWLLQVKKAGNLESIFLAANRENAPIIEDLWKNSAIQATYERINELKMLPRVASYFLNRAAEILRDEYEPSDTDIIFAENVSLWKGPASVEFSFPKPVHDGCMLPGYHHDPYLRYNLIRVQLRNLGGNYKWLNMFEDVEIVLFCVNLIDYDQFSDDGNGSFTNKMLETRNLFESIVTHPIFHKKDFLLILNKADLFEEKINQVPLNRCDWFKEFNPLISHHSNSTNPSLAQRAFHYIGAKFKNLYKSLNGLESECKLYVSVVTALEADTVDKALRNSREILKWNEEKENFITSGMTSYSHDASSSQFSQ